jgi:hypothetical protein
VVAAASLVAGQTAAAQPAPDSKAVLDAPAGSAGVEVFTSDPFAGPHPSERAATALAAAQARAEAHPKDLGGAYFDRRTGEVVSTTATAAGARLAVAAEAGLAAVPIRVKAVGTNYATLQGIQHASISDKGLPGYGSIYGTFVQAEKNRVVVEANEVTPALRKALADRYGVLRVAIHLTPGRQLPTRDYGGRRYDQSAFLGGAYLLVPEDSFCTSGFSWRNGGYHGMLTAGHCVANGGAVSTAAGYLGTTISNNWNHGVGTVRYPNDPYDRGDLGLVQIPAGAAASDARIYVGGPSSTLWRNVVARFTRKSVEGDKYCVGGSVSGELCGFQAYTASYDVKYGDEGVARNVTAGFTGGSNAQSGDSGGPVYQVNSAGQVVAKGIHSGHGSNWEYFTEITDAVNALPGDIALR